MSMWKHRLRVTVFDESSYSEIRVFRGSPRGWAWGIVGATALVVTATYLLVAQTPLREHLVPGYVAEATRADMRETRAMADSLAAILTRQEMSLWALRHSLAGDSAAMAFLQGASEPEPRAEVSQESNEALSAGAGEGERALRDRIEQEDRFSLQRRSTDANNNAIGFDFLPVAGGVSDHMDVGIGHLWGGLGGPGRIRHTSCGRWVRVVQFLRRGNGIHLDRSTPRRTGVSLQTLRVPSQTARRLGVGG